MNNPTIGQMFQEQSHPYRVAKVIGISLKFIRVRIVNSTLASIPKREWERNWEPVR